MTKSSSAGSNPSAKDAQSGPSPYGTRSRNRGQPRPNYAEDKDVDTDMFDVFPDKKEEEPKKPSRQAANGASEAPRTNGSGARKGALADEGKAGNASSTPKEQQHHSGTPASSATTTTTPTTTTSTTSKKRKAHAHSATNGAQSHQATTATQSSASTRRGTASNTPAASTSAGYKETNMLTFDRCGAKPKDGKLVADDGTVIEQNGMCRASRRSPLLGVAGPARCTASAVQVLFCARRC